MLRFAWIVAVALAALTLTACGGSIAASTPQECERLNGVWKDGVCTRSGGSTY